MKTSLLLRGLMVGLGLTLAQPLLAKDTPVRFGVDAYTTGSQIWVAAEKGYFAEAQIKPESTTYAIGVEANDGLLIGREDMSVGLDFPIVTRLSGGKMTVLAGIFHSAPGFHKLVVVNDIKTAARLKGKKIGLATGTAEHLITLKYLEENGLSEDDVQIVGFTSLMEIVASLGSGRIDAAFV
ncbi:ABC transporter substrate-binding protein [Pseudooceanicola sp. CBS1P-1]|uniref:SsuA/THI5-like domain-containing protein n=1 Tax=Pseudooceanicola albus TaxID=2692189 RepID=A0A6L7G5T6_9RHOB|nr:MULTISPECIES: ABC transporter substrate-binding protein [Pseudooceanicola]MBT9386172.1 ABC transporter substrate-binding protein [Pseudooceanicola endophyticus]MXN19411.1 hypothetical protein [Pseudooceanicola albus]